MNDPVQKLVALLGKPISDATCQSTLREFGESQRDSYDQALEYYDQGFTISIRDGRFAAVYLYSDFAFGGGVNGCKGVLPWELDFSMRMEDVECKLGRRNRVRRLLDPDLFRETYELTPYLVSISYDSKTECMMMVCVEFYGIFSDTSELARSYTLRRMDKTTVTLFERGCEIPAYSSQILSTSDDGQHAIEIQIFSTEENSNSEDDLYAAYIIHGISQAERGSVKVEVRFEALINGHLKVTARDERTKRELQITPK